MSYYNLIKVAEMSKSKKESLREKFNDKVLYPTVSGLGLGGLGSALGYSSGKSAISKAVDKAKEEANTIINSPGGLNDEKVNLENIVANHQKKVDTNNLNFTNKLQNLENMADDIVSNKNTKIMSLDELGDIINNMGKEDIGKNMGALVDDLEELKNSKNELLKHEEKIRNFREGKIQDARKLLKNTVGLRTLAGGVGAGTLGYGAYNMYRNMRNKD